MAPTVTTSSSSFKLFHYLPFPLKTSQASTLPERSDHTTTTASGNNKPPNQQNSKPACIAILVGRDGIPVTKCIAPAHRETNRPLIPKKQRQLSSLLLPKFRSPRGTPFVLSLHDRLEQLPTELLIHTIAYLDLSSVLLLSSTSKFYHRLCGPSNQPLWKALYRAHYPYHQQSSLSTVTTPPYHYALLLRDLHSLNRRFHSGSAQSHYLVGHQDSVYCIAWINSRQILSGSRDRTIKLWDVDQRGACLKTRQQHRGSVLCLAVANDGTFFVSGSSDATLIRWSLPSMTSHEVLEGHTGGVLDVCLVGDWIVSASRDTTVRVWSTTRRYQLVGHGGPVNALASIENNTTQVLSASGDMTVKLWDVDSAQCLRTFVGHQRGLACVRFDPFLRAVISGAQDGRIKVWDIDSSECLQTMTGHGDLVRTVDSYQGTVVSGSYDRTLRVWDASSGTCLLSFHSGHTSWIFNVLINRTKVISAGQDKKIMILDFGYDLNNL